MQLNIRGQVLLPAGPVVGPGIELNVLQPLDECDILDLIKHSAKKSCPCDPAPTSLVVSCLDILLLFLRV